MPDGYAVEKHDGRTDVSYEKATGKTEKIIIHADRISVGGKDYSKSSITDIFAKMGFWGILTTQECGIISSVRIKSAARSHPSQRSAIGFMDALDRTIHRMLKRREPGRLVRAYGVAAFTRQLRCYVSMQGRYAVEAIYRQEASHHADLMAEALATALY